VRRAARLVALLVATQLLVGLVNLALLAPVPLQLLHLVLADGVWLSVVALAACALAEDAPRLHVQSPAAAQRS
jgi:cytochrome c oxidase assembly protein subunit 15